MGGHPVTRRASSPIGLVACSGHLPTAGPQNEEHRRAGPSEAGDPIHDSSSSFRPHRLNGHPLGSEHRLWRRSRSTAEIRARRCLSGVIVPEPGRGIDDAGTLPNLLWCDRTVRAHEARGTFAMCRMAARKHGSCRFADLAGEQEELAPAGEDLVEAPASELEQVVAPGQERTRTIRPSHRLRSLSVGR